MDRYLRDRIENITEADFWSAIRPTGDLRAAVEAGRAGHRARAYAALGDRHAQSLRPELDAFKNLLAATRTDPKALDQLRDRADMVRRHEIQGWHGRVITFGDRIDFNADFGRSGQYGFHYLGWLVPARDQYALTGDRRYRDCLLDILLQYYDQRNKLEWRIPKLHPVYYELGATAKTAVFLPAYALLTHEGGLTASQHEAFLKLFLGMARSLFRLQKGGFRSSNWQIVGAKTLLHLGCAFPEFSEAAKWRRRGLEVIMMHVRQGFYADGGHHERCWGYGWMSLDGMLNAYETGMRYGRLGRHRAPLARVLRKAFRWFAAALSPSLEMLNYGDGEISSGQHILATARRVFPDMDRGPGLLGVDRSRSRILRPSGYAFMVAGEQREDPFMSINFGRWGGGHTHHDLLDFSVWCYGDPLIEEVGRYGSYDNPLDPFFRSAVAHNQVVLEHMPMDRIKHDGQQVAWHSTDEVDLFSAYHDAYRDACGARVYRQIVFVKPGYWVIHDTVHAQEEVFQVSSYLHAPRPFRILAPGRARVQGAKGCLVAFAEPEGIRRFTTAVDYSRRDYTVPHGRSPERHRLVATSWRDIGDPRPVTFTTVLAPFKAKQPPRVSIEAIACRGGAQAFAVTTASRGDLVVFNPFGGSDVCVGKHAISGPVAARIGRKWFECR